VICVCDAGGALNVTEMRADGSDRHALHADQWEHGEPTYAPDGRMIAYTRNVDGDYSVWVVPSGGGTPRQLTADEGHATHPSWAASGRAITYLSDSPIAPPDVWSVEVETGTK